MDQMDSLTVVQRFLEVTAQHVGLTTADVGLVQTIVFQVDESERKVSGRESDGEAVDKEDDARQEEDKEKEENISLHGDPVLYKQCSDVGVRGKDEITLWFSSGRSFNQFSAESLGFLLTDCYTL